MLPRNRVIGIVAVVLLLFFMVVPGYCDKNPIIEFYQAHISVVDGNRCPMHPSCSSYAAQAIEKHGAAIGWVMALDRLVRCGRDESKLSSSYKADGQSLIVDPVEANDFWWFNKDKIK